MTAPKREWVISWNDDGEFHSLKPLIDLQEYEAKKAQCEAEGRDWPYDHVIPASELEAANAEIERLKKMLEYERQREFPTQGQRELSLALELDKANARAENFRHNFIIQETTLASTTKERDALKAEVEKLKAAVDFGVDGRKLMQILEREQKENSTLKLEVERLCKRIKDLESWHE